MSSSVCMTVASRFFVAVGFGLRLAGVAGRLADHLAHLQAAAGEQERREVAPVVAAAVAR